MRQCSVRGELCPVMKERYLRQRLTIWQEASGGACTGTYSVSASVRASDA